MVERRPTDVVPGPKLRFAAAAIVFDLVSPRGLVNKLLLGLAAPVLPKTTNQCFMHQYNTVSITMNQFSKQLIIITRYLLLIKVDIGEEGGEFVNFVWGLHISLLLLEFVVLIFVGMLRDS